jgi:hypothetical protein
MNRSKLKWLILFLLLFGVLGYIRENFFVHINNILYIKYYNRPGVEVPAVMQPFERFSYNTLYYAKYPFTLLWTAIFFLASYFAVNKLTGNPFLVRVLVISYAIMIGLAGLSIIYSFLAHGRPETSEYTFSRWLLGIAQSPLVCLVLLAGSRLLKTESTTN